VRWVYDAVEARLFRERQRGRDEVPLSRQQHRLVAFMVERNQRAGGKPALCERDELIGAVWGDEPDHSPQDLAYLVHQLRGRLGPQPGDPPLIVNERGRGYRLLVEAEAPSATPVGAGAAQPMRSRRLLFGAVGAGMAIVVAAATVNLLTRPEPILREGSRGQDVLTLQHDLIAAGYDPVYLDGQYGPLTARAVRGFQQDNGLVVDGEVGPDTHVALRRALETRAHTPVAP